MPLHRRELLLTVGSTIASFARPALAAEPTHILVIGDSQAQGLAAGLQRQLRSDATWRVIDRSHIATGLYLTGRFDWPAQVQTISAAEPGAVAVVMDSDLGGRVGSTANPNPCKWVTPSTEPQGVCVEKSSTQP